MGGGIIYLVTCSVNGKHYVGQTVGPLWRRWKQHRQAHGGWRNTALWAAIQKYGADAFDRRILECVSRLEDLNAREVYWAGVYHAIAPEGYSLKVGNGHNVVVGEETRAKLSAGTRKAWMNPDHRAQRIALMTASQHQPDVVARKSIAATQSWKNPDHRLKRTTALRVALNTPEVKAHRSALQTPEIRARTAELMRARWADPAWRAERVQMFKRPIFGTERRERKG